MVATDVRTESNARVRLSRRESVAPGRRAAPRFSIPFARVCDSGPLHACALRKRSQSCCIWPCECVSALIEMSLSVVSERGTGTDAPLANGRDTKTSEFHSSAASAKANVKSSQDTKCLVDYLFQATRSPGFDLAGDRDDFGSCAWPRREPHVADGDSLNRPMSIRDKSFLEANISKSASPAADILLCSQPE